MTPDTKMTMWPMIHQKYRCSYRDLSAAGKTKDHLKLPAPASSHIKHIRMREKRINIFK